MIDPVPIPPEAVGLLDAQAVEDLAVMPQLLAAGELFCDFCGGQLRRRNVSVLFLEITPGVAWGVAFVHPGRCARSFFASLGGAA